MLLKKTVFPIALWCMALVAGAQTTQNWGLQINPNFSSRRLVVFESLSQAEIDAIDSIETYKPSWSAGLFVQWRGEKVGFQMGLNFMDTGYRTIKTQVLPDDPDAANASQRRITYQNYFLEAPIDLYFYQALDDNNEFIFTFGTGVGYNLTNFRKQQLYQGDSKGDSSRETDPDNDNFRKVAMEIRFGMGWETQLSERLSFALLPNFQFWTKGLYQDAGINRHLYAIGVQGMLRFR